MIVTACLLIATLCGGPASSHAAVAPGALSCPHRSEVVHPVSSPNPDILGPTRPLPSQADAPTEPDVEFSTFFSTLGWNFTRGLLSADNLLPLAIGGGAALAAHPLDTEVSDRFVGDAEALGDAGHLVENSVTIAVSVGAILIGAQLTNDRRFRRFAYTLTQAQVIDTTLKVGLKGAVSRTRPNGENNNAFPSGHTSTTFTFATVAAHYYGTKVGIPAYAIATLVGLSRIENGKHFPSDVVFGATLGYIAGRTAVRGTERSTQRRQVTVLPVMGWGRTGLLAAVTF